MYNRIKHILTFIWPLLESIILALLIGLLANTLAATMVIIFIVIFIFSLFYGTIIKGIGWGIFGCLLTTHFNLLSIIFFLVFFSVRFFGAKLIKKLAS